MRQEFGWAVAPNPADLKKTWKASTLVVDANVLLDLYRYHEKTRESLLDAIEKFRGRLWISNQAAIEFFRNRKSVIMSSEKTFSDAVSAIEDLRKATETATSRLKGLRLIPRTAADDLKKAADSAVEGAIATIHDARAAHPDYIQDDQLLVRIMALFDGRVGSPLDAERTQELITEGERRISEKVPPGYLDTDKDGDRRLGDFFHWRETLNFGKETGSPIILVTSERKEDWWEKYSGRTVGPRQELLSEAYAFTGRQILIYQTEHFLEVSAKQFGHAVDQASVEEIREVGVNRSGRKAGSPAVRVTQNVEDADSFDNKGLLEIELLRPLYQFTGSGAFDPHLALTPRVSAEIISAPDGCPTVAVAAATGTTFDFNVHIRSIEHGAPLPPGSYIIKYSADVWEDLFSESDATKEEKDEGEP